MLQNFSLQYMISHFSISKCKQIKYFEMFSKYTPLEVNNMSRQNLLNVSKIKHFSLLKKTKNWFRTNF